MTESLLRPLVNLRAAIRAAEAAAVEKRAPATLCGLLSRSAHLLDGLFLVVTSEDAASQFRTMSWAHQALTQAREALHCWNAWVEGHAMHRPR